MHRRLALPLACLAALACEASDEDAFLPIQSGPEEVEPEPPTFTDVADAVLRDAHAQERCAAGADFDGDGDPDLFLGNPLYPSALLLNRGDGTFERQEGSPTTGIDEGCSAADYDNDGDPDLYIGCGGWHGPCADALYRNDGVDPETGELVLTDVSDASGISAVEASSFGLAWDDFDGDGWLDLLVSTKRDFSDPEASYPLILWRNRGDGTFADVAAARGIDLDNGEHQASWIDYDLDGDPDLFVPGFFEENALYRNDGGYFTDVTPDAMQDPMLAFGSAAADVDGDGIEDLVVSAHSNATWIEWETDLPDDPPYVFLGDGAGGFEAIDPALLYPPDTGTGSTTMGLQTGDLDGDGRAEIFLGNGQPGGGTRNELFSPRIDGSALSFDHWTDAIDYAATPGPDEDDFNSYPYRTHGTVFADFDGDGDLDVFVGNGGMSGEADQDEPNRLFRNDLEGVPYLVLDLRGTESNRDAVGALAVITGAEGRVRRHRVRRSTGFNSSSPRVQTVGLAGFVGPVSVEVSWPAGGTSAAEAELGERVTLEE